jgi:uncharacterized protein (TIGR03086 family)
VRDLVSVLAEPNRRRLLELLAQGERSAGDLATHFGVTRSAVSQHLGVLARAGLVDSRQQGRHRYYRLNPEGMGRLRSSLDMFWSNELEALAAVRPARKESAAMMLEKSVVVPLGPEETFALLTEPERLRRWQAVTARIDLRAGGEFRWTITPGHIAAGTVVEVEPGRRVVLGWGWEQGGDPPPGTSTLTITVEPADGGTLVRLVHEGLTEEQATGHALGWDHYFERLEAAARAGDAGPDEWASAPEPLDQLSAAEASLAVCQRVLRGLTTGDAERRSPCAKFTVHELVVHLVGSMHHLGQMVGAPATSSGPGNPETLVADASQAALEAWRRRGTEGTVPFGGGEMPAQLAATILSVELLVHAWDLATATGQAVVVSDAVSDYVLAHARELIAPAARDGDRFAAEIAAGPDAGSLERLVAFTGRNP